MKLNIGCGHRRIPGYTGVDAVARESVDIVALAHEIPLPDGAAEEIMAIHVWEHFYRWDCDTVITEWKRLLRPGGLLVLEMPDVMKCCMNLIKNTQKGGKHPDQLSYWGIYGDPRTGDPFMNHRWGWTPQTLTAFLAEHGFTGMREEKTTFHRAGRDYRDMRIVSTKAGA